MLTISTASPGAGHGRVVVPNEGSKVVPNEGSKAGWFSARLILPPHPRGHLAISADFFVCYN